MNKASASQLCIDAALQEYYDACARDSGDSDNESGDESDQDSASHWRSTCRSPLRGKARLRLYQRGSVQQLLREKECHTLRGKDAETTASLLAKPLAFATEPHDDTDLASTVLFPSEDTPSSTFGAVDKASAGEKCIVFDALSALRQTQSHCFEKKDNTSLGRSSGPPVWALRQDTLLVSTLNALPLSAQTLVEALVAASNDVARAQWQLRELSASSHRGDTKLMEDGLSHYSMILTGEEALHLTASLTLRRFCTVVQGMIRQVADWALGLQQGEHFQQSSPVRWGYSWRVNVLQCLENVLLPVRRCVQIMEQACSLISETSGNMKTTSEQVGVVVRASELLDFLIVRTSALQRTSTMGLYRFYMVLLVYCSLPYTLLMTCAIFGFVTDIDPDVWRSSMPRIFRLSFSHIRVGDGQGDKNALMLPTDILSLVFLCVGYERVGARGVVCNNNSCDIQHQELDRARRRAAFGAMMFSRSFILHSFVAFAKQKTLTGWSGGTDGSEPGHQLEMLRTFDSFELRFALPLDVDLILLPQNLSVTWSEGGQLQEVYTSCFWNRRIGCDPKNQQRCGSPTSSGHQRRRGTWCYIFGYLCALFYAQISLREERKQLQRRGGAVRQARSWCRYRKSDDQAQVSRIVRGLGSAYFELSFAVDSLVSFTRNTVGAVVHELETLTDAAGAAVSCITLCQRIDALLLRLHTISFPVTASKIGAEKCRQFSDSVRECITALLTISLDPASLPVRHVVSRTHSTVETLVTTVRTIPVTSMLREHLQPLLVLLSFNGFYDA
uniref:Uncharacterized protein n=1 Tax=Trypanosoma vivax (strain Y486) TaxID=1055687 RepID=G0UAN3_TRYVY|nr:conserved hypothetical protein, fragment [Trypanosoma vivax Y486]